MEGTDRDPLRVLFACVPQPGHLLPLLPLASAFAARGDEVVVATGPAGADVVHDHGLAYRGVCPDLDEWFGRLAGRTRGGPGDGLAVDRVERYFVPRLFAEIGLDLMLDGLDALASELRPDLLIFEPYALAAPLVAARHGIAPVQHGIGLPVDPLVVELTSDAVTPAWRAAGLDTPHAAGLYDGASLSVCPPGLQPGQPAGPGPALSLRPTPLPDRGAPLPVALPHPDRPLVYVTLGTFSNANLPLFRLILAALEDLPVSVLVTLGRDSDPADLGAIPSNATATTFVPQAALLPHCAAVVHHAGAGTTFGVLAHGLPAVVLPQSADNFSLADRLSAVGAATRLLPDEVTEDAVRAATRAALSDPARRRVPEALAEEIAAMPGPAEVVDRLRLSGSRGRVTP
ncbi:MAG: glycosyltransferase [Mycobacteriales bacterium]